MSIENQTKELANKIINDWHNDDRNFIELEPDGLKLARLVVLVLAAISESRDRQRFGG